MSGTSQVSACMHDFVVSYKKKLNGDFRFIFTALLKVVLVMFSITYSATIVIPM